MCDFVAVGTAQRFITATAHFERKGLSAWPATNPALQSFFPATDAVLWVTTGGCSCDLYFDGPSPFDEDRWRAKYARKGWSTAKIDRAVAAKRAHPERSPPTRDAFRAAVDSLVREVGEVRLHAHEYRANQQLEAVAKPLESHVTLAEFLEHDGAFPRDTLVTVTVGERERELPAAR